MPSYSNAALPPILSPPSAVSSSALPPLNSTLPASSAPSSITINLSDLPSLPSTATAHAHPSVTHPLSSPQPAHSILPSPTTTSHDSAQKTKWAELVAHFDEAHLRQHEWEWSSKDKDWLPIYKYQAVVNISDIWTEWAEGIGGFVSVRDLTERWGARWRRNNAGLRTEASRRRKVVDLVNELSSKHLWNVNLALRFLQDKYEPKYKARSFCDYLAKEENKKAVLQAAIGYPS